MGHNGTPYGYWQSGGQADKRPSHLGFAWLQLSDNFVFESVDGGQTPVKVLVAFQFNGQQELLMRIFV